MYKDIYELPVKIYHKIVETGNLDFLYINKPTEIDTALLEKTWEEIHEQLINEFGVSEEFKAMFYKQQDINKFELQALMGDQSAYTHISVFQSDLDRIKSRIHKVENYRKHHASLYMAVRSKYQVDPRSLTTFEFYNALTDMKKESEEREMEVLRNNGTDG
jgi:hypothetical protein